MITRSSVALDMGNTDQEVSGNEFVKIIPNRVIWDFAEDVHEMDFIAPVDGIYSHDLQVQVKNCVNVDYVEIALFKETEESEDYWFICDKKKPDNGLVHLNGATQLDMYEGEKFYLKIKLHGENPSATIEGSDDYTAFGFNYSSPIGG